MAKERQPKKQRRASADAEPSTSGRPYTVTLAVSASCIDNAQNLETASMLAGSIARAATVFCVDEVVIIDDSGAGKGRVGKAAALLARVLQYLETPQYLRKALLPMHGDLRHVGLLAPLDAPHHMRAGEWCAFREGVVTCSDPHSGSFVDVGLDKEAWCEEAAAVGRRVTLLMGERPQLVALPRVGQVYQAQVVAPHEPREVGGLYWGYTTRIAPCISALFDDCPFPGGYDLRLGTSEHGTPAPDKLPPFRHALIAFGGPTGLEECATRDAAFDKPHVSSLFNQYINTCPGQGSRTIRTEEAILISMAALQPALRAGGTGRK